jgi:hypothetical protein
MADRSGTIRQSIVIPVYKNEGNIPALLAAMEKLIDSFDAATR